VHIEFVYGRFSILPKRTVGIRTASFGLLVIFLSMLLLSLLRSKIKASRLTRQSAVEGKTAVRPARS